MRSAELKTRWTHASEPPGYLNISGEQTQTLVIWTGGSLLNRVLVAGPVRGYFPLFPAGCPAAPGCGHGFRHLEDLDIVQQTLAQDCKGRVVSPAEAQAIKQRRQAYLRRVMGDKAWRPREGLGFGGTGSGFAVSAQGHILTNHHVVADCQAISALTPAGRESEVRLLKSEPARDLALLIMAEAAPDPALFAAPETRLTGARLAGTAVRFLGYPNRGRVPLRPFDQPGRILQLTGGTLAVPVIVFKGEIRPGNSGGPLLTPAGQVIGLVFGQANVPAIYRTAGNAAAARAAKKMTNIGLALPFWEILLFLEQAGVPYEIATGAEEAPAAEQFMVRVNCWK